MQKSDIIANLVERLCAGDSVLGRFCLAIVWSPALRASKEGETQTSQQHSTKATVNNTNYNSR